MEEKEYAGSYRIEQMLRFGKKHFVLGLDDKAEEKYLLAERHTNAFGYEYTEAVVSNDYLEIVEELTIRMREELERVREERAKRQSDGIPFGPEACRAESSKLNYENQILVLNPAYLAPEYRTKEDQLVLAISGFGCAPGHRSHKIYCQCLSDGEKFQIRGNDVLGILDQRFVPHWANEKAAAMRNALRKQREASAMYKNER